MDRFLSKRGWKQVCPEGRWKKIFSDPDPKVCQMVVLDTMKAIQYERKQKDNQK